MAKPKTPSFPAECCGVCKYSHMVDKDLQCFALPPAILSDDDGFSSLRGMFVNETDHACIYFKGREHA